MSTREKGALSRATWSMAPISRSWASWLQNLAGVGVLAGFAWYLFSRREHFAGVLQISRLDVAALVALTGVAFLVISAQSYLLFRAAGVRFSFRENLLLSLATFFGNYLPMRLGTLTRARYLKVVHGLGYARFGSVFGVRVVLTVVATGVMGLIGTLGLALTGGHLSIPLLALFLAFAVLPASILIWKAPSPPRQEGRAFRALYDFAAGVAELRRRPSLSLQVLGLLMVQYAAAGARFYVAARAIGEDVSPLLVGLLAPVASLANFTALTPGALGLREAVMGYVTYAAGTSFSAGAYLGTLDRMVLLVVVALTGGPAFLWVWMRVSHGTQGLER